MDLSSTSSAPPQAQAQPQASDFGLNAPDIKQEEPSTPHFTHAQAHGNVRDVAGQSSMDVEIADSQMGQDNSSVAEMGGAGGSAGRGASARGGGRGRGRGKSRRGGAARASAGAETAAGAGDQRSLSGADATGEAKGIGQQGNPNERGRGRGRGGAGKAGRGRGRGEGRGRGAGRARGRGASSARNRASGTADRAASVPGGNDANDAIGAAGAGAGAAVSNRAESGRYGTAGLRREGAGQVVDEAVSAAAAGGAGMGRGRRPYTHRGVFTKDLSRLMYAFGDNAFPDPSSVSVMEELLVDFITDLCHRARPSPFSVARGAMPVVFPSIISDPSDLGGAGAGAGAANSAASNPNNLDASSGASQSQSLPPSNSHALNLFAHLTRGAPITSARAGPLASPHPFAARARLKVEDVKMALRKEPKKLARVEELIFLDKVISDARKMLNVDPAAPASASTSTTAPTTAAPGEAGTADAHTEAARAADQEQSSGT